MSEFTDTVKQDTPRLVVMFRRDGDNEMFQWGMVGAIPILTLVGYIVRVQAELAFRAPEKCPESALVIAYTRFEVSTTLTCKYQLSWFVHPDIPVDSLVGMLETIKQTILTTHMARTAAAQQVQLLGPDGQPMRR